LKIGLIRELEDVSYESKNPALKTETNKEK